MNWSVSKIGTVYQEPAQAIGRSAPPTPPIGCVLDLPGLPGAGNKIYDRSPYGNIGTKTGTVWKRLPSGLWYQDFDGSDDYVDCGNDASLKRYNSDFTIEAWIRLDSYPSTWVGAILSNRGGGGSMFYVVGESDTTRKRQLCLDVNGGADAYRFIYGTSKLALDTWYHTAATFRYKGGNNNEGQLFLGGSFENINSAMTDVADLGATATWIGWEPSQPANYAWNGCIALLRIYNRTLSALEIQNHYQQERHLFGV